jgi:hypothetical protein
VVIIRCTQKLLRRVGDSKGPGQSDAFTARLHLDVLAAVGYLRSRGATSISLIGGRLGGGAAADAAVGAEPGDIHRLVRLGTGRRQRARKNESATLFIVTKDDGNAAGLRLPEIRAQYDRAPDPKELIVWTGPRTPSSCFKQITPSG